MAYEKADFWAAYRTPCLTADAERWRMYGFRHPSLNGLVDYNPATGVTLFQHYVPAAIKPLAEHNAALLVQHYIDQGTPLTSDSTVAVIGGAFGWLGEALEDLVPGLEACSLDTSQYVQDVKALSPDDELIENITASGYDHTLPNSVGEWLFNTFSDPNPRSRSPERVAQNDLSTVKLRNDARKLFQKNAIDHIITEEVWQLLTQEEQTRYTAAAADYGATLTHIIDGVII